MLEMNLNTQINNINFLEYMQHCEKENEALNCNMESERATQNEKYIQKLKKS